MFDQFTTKKQPVLRELPVRNQQRRRILYEHHIGQITLSIIDVIIYRRATAGLLLELNRHYFMFENETSSMSKTVHRVRQTFHFECEILLDWFTTKKFRLWFIHLLSELCWMNIVVEHRSILNECELYSKINQHKSIIFEHIQVENLILWNWFRSFSSSRCICTTGLYIRKYRWKCLSSDA